jgi:hypothetical protein
MLALREKGGIDPTHFFNLILDGVSGHFHAPAAIYTLEWTPVPTG